MKGIRMFLGITLIALNPLISLVLEDMFGLTVCIISLFTIPAAVIGILPDTKECRPRKCRAAVAERECFYAAECEQY